MNEKYIRRAILKQIKEWHNRHHSATTVFNPGRWGDGRPQFIIELEKLFNADDLRVYLSSSQDLSDDDGVEYKPEVQASDIDKLKLFFILEARLLRNSMSARNTSFQSLWSASFESNSAKVHHELDKLFNDYSPEQKAAYKKIMRYLYLDGRYFHLANLRRIITLAGKDLKKLSDLANICEQAYHSGETDFDAFISDPKEYQKNHPPKELGVHVAQDHFGHGYWQFAPLESKQDEPPESSFLRFANFGRLPDNGLLSNKLINLFGKQALIGLKDKAERLAQKRPYSDRNEKLESIGIQLNQWMVDGIRSLQDLDLLLNCDDLEGGAEKRKARFKEHKKSVLAKLDERIKKVIEEKNKYDKNSPEYQIYQLFEDSFSKYKQEVVYLLIQYDNKDFSHSDMLNLQQELYRDLLRKYQRVQGYVSAKQNFFFENNDNSILLREAQDVVQNHTMAYGLPVTEDMLNQKPAKNEKHINIGDMEQNELGLFAAQLVDDQDAHSEASMEVRLPRVHERYNRVKVDLEKAHLDDSLRKAHRSLPVRGDRVLFENQVSLAGESEVEKQARAHRIERLRVKLKTKQTELEFTEEPATEAELFKFTAFKGRNSVRAVGADDLGTNILIFFKNFFGYFNLLGAQRPFVMLGAFSIPYVQFGGTALGLLSTSSVATHLQALGLFLAKTEAGILHLAHIPVTGADISQLITFIDKNILYYTGTENAFEALITAGFIPAKAFFVMADTLMNAALSAKENQDWLSQMRNKYSALKIENKLPEVEVEEGIKSILSLSLQLTLSVLSGVGIHTILASNIPVLPYLLTPLSYVCNVDPNIFAGALLSNVVQKTLTIKTAGIIFAKAKSIVEHVEENQVPFSTLSQLEVQEKMKILRIKEIEKFRKNNSDCDELFVDQLKDGDIKNFAEFNAKLKQLQASKPQLYGTAEVHGKLPPVGDLLATLDLSYGFANSNPQPNLSTCKKNQLFELVRTQQLRNTNRQVMQVDDPDHKTLMYFIELAHSSEYYIPDDEEFTKSKKQFENLLFENPELWSLFEDPKAMGQLSKMKVQRVEFSPLARVGRFLWKDLFMRYGVGTLAAPFTALYVLYTGNKDDVVYPFRQFLGTTLLPAIFRMAFYIVNVIPGLFVPSLLMDLGRNLFRHGLDTSKWAFSITKGVANAWGTVLYNAGLLGGNIAGAVLMPVVYVLARIPELFIAAATTNPFSNLGHLIAGVGLGALAIVTTVFPGSIAFLAGGLFKVFGFDRAADKCFDVFKAPYKSFSKAMRAISDWRASHSDPDSIGQRVDNTRAYALGWWRETVRVPIEERMDKILIFFRDFFRKSEQVSQKVHYEIAEERHARAVELAAGKKSAKAVSGLGGEVKAHASDPPLKSQTQKLQPQPATPTPSPRAAQLDSSKRALR